MEITPEHDERVMKIVAQVRSQPPEKRDSFLRVACDRDSDLYKEIAETLDWEDRMGGFLQEPLIALTLVARAFEPGHVIESRFEIVRVIGEGGMGIVYEAIDRKRNQRIAIKAAKPGFYRLLSPELEGALKVRHPNICLVNEIHTARTDHGEVDFLTMELLEGETLSAYLSAHGKVNPNDAIEIARQLCTGLAEAHRSGVIHRDLKSDNIILCRTATGGFRAVITDFGLAGSTTESGVLAGTPRYMAPELWRGVKTSIASDIYSLGVVLYEIVTGQLPFDDDDSVADRLTRLPRAPSTQAEAIERRWDRAILPCLDVSPAERPSDATQVLAVLEKKQPWKALLVTCAFVVFTIGAFAVLIPSFRQRLVEFVWPSPGVRLAVLPCEGPNDTAAICGGAAQDVSDRVRHFQSGHRTVVIISPAQVLSNHIQTPEQAGQVLHATHALQTTVVRQGNEFIAQASVIDLRTGVRLRDFSGRYSLATLGKIPAALAGAVSAALRLHGDASEVLSPTATGPYDRGLYLLRTYGQSFEEAISQFEQAARLDPRSSLPLAGLVEAEIMKFNVTKDRSSIEEAQRFLSAAESLNPDSVRVHLAAGLLKETTSQYEKALEDYRRVQDLEPGNIDALLRIARIYDKLDMPDKAIEAYRKASDMDPAYYRPFENLGEFYYYRGRYQEAAEQFQETIKRAPGMFDAYTNLAAALDNLGRDAEAEQALLASLKLRETARALNSMGAIRAFQKRDEDAVQYYKRAVELDPQTYVYFLNLGDSNRRLGRLRNAEAAFRKAMDLALNELKENPRRGYTRAFVGYFAAMLGDRKRAEDEIGQAMQLSPGDNEVVRCAALTYLALGERDRAIEVLSAATPELLRELDRHPDLAEFRNDPRFEQLVARTTSGGK
jgi:tetratricopeptide (TPR) repeat protein